MPGILQVRPALPQRSAPFKALLLLGVLRNKNHAIHCRTICHNAGKSLCNMVPALRLERRTYRLQGGCSTY